MKFFLVVLLLFFARLPLGAQTDAVFTPIDFSSNSEGDIGAFVFRADKSVQTHAPSDTNRVRLVKMSANDFGSSWKISLQMNLNPSNSNNVRFYILSDSVNLVAAKNAYYVTIGNNSDEVSLYSQTAGGATKVIDGQDGRLNRDTVRVEVVVSLDRAGHFSLWSKRADETAYFEEGAAQIKQNYKKTSHIGFVCTYSSKNTDKFIIKEVAAAFPAGGGDSPEPDMPSNPNKPDDPANPEESSPAGIEGFSLSAKSFSPAGEPLFVRYSFPEAGYVARIITFDSGGNKIEELANNTSLAREGQFRLMANYPEGIIIVFAEARTPGGRFIRQKIPLVCGR